jgi:hypothetical protein
MQRKPVSVIPSSVEQMSTCSQKLQPGRMCRLHQHPCTQKTLEAVSRMTRTVRADLLLHSATSEPSFELRQHWNTPVGSFKVIRGRAAPGLLRSCKGATGAAQAGPGAGRPGAHFCAATLGKGISSYSAISWACRLRRVVRLLSQHGDCSSAAPRLCMCIVANLTGRQSLLLHAAVTC